MGQPLVVVLSTNCMDKYRTGISLTLKYTYSIQRTCCPPSFQFECQSRHRGHQWLQSRSTPRRPGSPLCGGDWYQRDIFRWSNKSLAQTGRK